MQQEWRKSYITCNLMLLTLPHAVCIGLQRSCTTCTTYKAAPLKRYLYTSLRFFLGMSMAAVWSRSRR